MASVDLVSPQGTTRTVTELGALQHLVNARGYTVASGTYADAVATLSGWVNHPTAASEADVVADPTTPLGAALKAAYGSTPDEYRAGKKLYLGDATAWSQYVSNAANGTITTGTDPVVGDYIRLSVTTVGTWIRAGRDLPHRLGGGRVISFLARRNDANLSEFDYLQAFGAYGLGSYVKGAKAAASFDVGVWRRVVLHPQSRDGVQGTLPTDFTDLRSIGFQVNATAGQTTSFDIADLRIHEGTGAGSVSFFFDDGRADTYTTSYRILAAKRFPAAIAVEYDQVGVAGRCTLAQLQELYAAGWAMCGHHTAQMTSLTSAQQITAHQGSKAFLRTNGFTRGASVWAWPGGARSTAVEATALNYWRTLRRTAAVDQLGAQHIYEPTDPAVLYIKTTTTLATVQGLVDRVVASGGNLTLVFHSLTTTPSATEDWLPADFAALVDYIAGTGVAVKPIDQVWTA